MKISRHKQVLIIEIPLKDYGVSKSGKTEIIATSHGSIRTGIFYKRQPVVVNVNAFVYRNTRED